jgi:biotin-dependent carboxylase-like uncharacterized protein
MTAAATSPAPAPARTGPIFEVINPGVQTTVQDLGRPGHLGEGIPPSGAFDATSLRLANLLVGNPVGHHILAGDDPGAAGLEMPMVGPTLRALRTTLIAVTGADMALTVDDLPMPLWASVLVRAGQRVTIGPARTGARGYLAVAGGLDVPILHGSRATNLRAGFGGFSGRALAAGDVLEAGESHPDIAFRAGRRIRPDRRPRPQAPEADHAVLRVVLGPQDHLFTPDSVEEFLITRWELSAVSDRMGCRFIGPTLYFLPRPEYLAEQAGADPSNIVDDSICIGSIQVPSGLEPIVMGVDGPSLGGYAKIATVLSQDLSVLAQLRPGDRVRFHALDPEAAEEAHLASRVLPPDIMENL